MINEARIATTDNITLADLPVIQGITDLRADMQQVETYEVSAGATASGNVDVTLNGVQFLVPVLSTDNTATLAATKLRAFSYAGWTTGGSGATVTFTYNSPGPLSGDFHVTGGATGVAGSLSMTTGMLADTVLVTGQTNGAENGPYKVVVGPWTRHTDHNTAAEFVRPWEIFIREGTYANWRFQFVNESTPTLGTSILNFEPFTREEVLQAGVGLDIEDGAVRIVNSFPSDDNWAGPGDVLQADAEGLVSGLFRSNASYLHLEGFIVEYVSTTAILIRAGQAFVWTQDAAFTTPEAFLNTQTAGGNITKTLSGLTANTLYYIYTDPVGNNFDTDLLIDATAPTLGSNFGDHYVKGPAGSEDYSRRYVGAFRTNASGQPYKFVSHRGASKYPEISYLENVNPVPFLVVNGGTATTAQTVNLGPSGLKLVPPTCQQVYLKVEVNATANAVFSNSEASTTLANTNYLRRVTAVQRVGSFFMPLDSSQSFTWLNNVAGGATDVSVLSYEDRR